MFLFIKNKFAKMLKSDTPFIYGTFRTKLLRVIIIYFQIQPTGRSPNHIFENISISVVTPGARPLISKNPPPPYLRNSKEILPRKRKKISRTDSDRMFQIMLAILRMILGSRIIIIFFLIIKCLLSTTSDEVIIIRM